MATPADDEVKEVLRRTERARLDRNRHQKRITDCYKFALPWRHKIYATMPVDQLDEIYDETAMTVVEDFASDNLNTFTPRKADWVEYKPVKKLDAGDQRLLADQLKKYQDVVFSEMARSNLYQALQESYLDLGVGTMAGLIQDREASAPLFCQAIPATELLIDRGPYGEVDGRFREWSVRGEDIARLWPKAKPPNGIAWPTDSLTEFLVIDGMWRDWSNKGDECWKYFVLCDGKIIFGEDYNGAGSCPMFVARWSRDSTTAWGVGPTYRTLPAIKTLNHVKYLLLKNLDKTVDPAFTYENDGVMAFDQGVTPGKGFAREVGSKAPEMMESKNKFDVGWVQANDLVSIIKRAHYQDEPEQRGKTPPSASQWADEAARRMRRMGTPAANLVPELQYPIVTRFGFLLNKRGVLPKIQLNGADVALEPISPLLRAQEQEEVVRGDRYLEMLGARFGPQVVNVVVDQIKYANWLSGKMGVPGDLLRNETQIAGAIKTFAPVLAHGNVPGDLSQGPAGAGVTP